MSTFDGRTLLGISKAIGPANTFWLRVSGSGGPDDCWIWTGCIGSNGYGRVSYQGGEKYAHREAWVQMKGPIPDGLQLDHLCRNRLCVNPDHLDPVPPRVNTRRGVSPGAQALTRGECKYGHSFEEWGALRTGRRICRLCKAAYSRAYNARVAAGLPTSGIDQMTALAGYGLEERVALARKAAHHENTEWIDMKELALSVERDRSALVAHEERRSAA